MRLGPVSLRQAYTERTSMCGRYLITSSPEAFRRLFGYPEEPRFPPRYNVAPTQPVPIVRMVEGVRQFALVRWGLVPPWVVCHEYRRSKRRCVTVREMKVGPSRPAVRFWPQIAASCCRQKRWW